MPVVITPMAIRELLHSDGHAYIKREGTPGNYRYWYPEDLEKAKAYQQQKTQSTTAPKRSTSKLNNDGKAAWQYTKDRIATDKKTEQEALKVKHEQKIEALKKDAEASRERISAKLEQLTQALAEKAAKEKQKIQERTSAEVEKLLEEKMPSGLTKKQKLKWINEKRAEIADLRGDAAYDKAAVDADTAQSQSDASASAAAQKQQVSAQLKSSIAAAREAYKISKQTLDKSYEDVYQAEYDRILADYSKPTKSKK